MILDFERREPVAARIKALPSSCGILPALLLMAGCGTAPSLPPTEDVARRAAPLPACFVDINLGTSSPSVQRSLKPGEYWQVLFPSYDSKKHELKTDAPTCTGRRVLLSSQFEGAALPPRTLAVTPDSITIGGGSDRLRVAWLRTFSYDDGAAGGPIMLVRPVGNGVEVYAVGVYVGSPDHTKLQLERMGSELLVVARDDGCEENPRMETCVSSEHVFLPRQGILQSLAHFDIERFAYAKQTEQGTTGPIQYHLQVAPSYILGGIKLAETIHIRNQLGQVIRIAELERQLTFSSETTMTPSHDPLWSRVYPSPKK